MEDWFQVGAFETTIARSDWVGMALRVGDNVRRVLDLFDQVGVKATFFTLGWVTVREPAAIRAIVERGHELASHGCNHGIRAWAKIYIAQFVGAEAAGRFDHIVYGWIFFGLVVWLILGVAWRWFEREPEEAGWSVPELRGGELFATLERQSAPTRALLLAMLALAADAAALAFGPLAG